MLLTRSRAVAPILLLLLACFCSAGGAQTTAISTTGVVDGDGTTWVNGTWAIAFTPNANYPNPAIYNINGTPLSTSVTTQSGSLNGSGAFSATVYDSSQVSPAGSGWALTICPQSNAPCGIYNFSTAGATQNITAGINSVIPRIRFRPVSGSYGYNDGEAILSLTAGGTYYNVISSCQRVYSGASWSCLGGSGFTPIFASGAPSGSCTNNTVYFNTATTPYVQYVCNVAAWVQVGSSGGTGTPGGITQSVQANNGAGGFGGSSAALVNTTTGTFFANSYKGVPTINIIAEGDSRMANSINGGAGGGGLVGGDVFSQLLTQPQFIGNYVNGVDLAVGGSTCASMTARISGLTPYEPNGTTVTKSYLFIEIGINDLRSTSLFSAVTEEVCVQQYINSVVALGFTPILNTVYYDGDGNCTVANGCDTQRQIFNHWLVTRPYMTVDIDAIVGQAQNGSELYAGTGPVVALSACTYASGVVSCTTGTQAYTANLIVYIDGFPSGDGSACLNHTLATISATGLTTTTIQFPSGCTGVVSADTGFSANAPISGGLLHLGAYGNNVWAKAANDRFGAGGIGTTYSLAVNRDTFNNPAGQTGTNANTSIIGCLVVGFQYVTGVGNNCAIQGSLILNGNAQGTGAIWFGNSTADLLRGTTGGLTWSSSEGGLKFTGTSGLSWTGGSIAACVAGATCAYTTNGLLITCTNTTCVNGELLLGSGSSLINNGSTIVWTLPFNLSFAGSGTVTLPALNVTASRKGTFVCTSGGAIVVPNTNYLVTSDVVFTTQTHGGTQTYTPNITAQSTGVSFTATCATGDTSTYNYDILN